MTPPANALSADRVAVLEVNGLRVRVPDRRGRLEGGFFAVDGVSFVIRRGETLARVGETGVGNTTLAKAIGSLINPSAGTILIDGADWSQLSSTALRGRRAVAQMVFQDPYGGLNPRMSIGRAVAAPPRRHTDLGPEERPRRVLELLEMVGLSTDTFGRRPKALSGGQRQRVAIARALACGSALVICDEPTAALDVSIQAQVLNLLGTIQRDLGVAYLFITHDLGVVRHIAHRVGVMYTGRFVEQGSAQDIFSHPLHPYTAMLLGSVLTLEPRAFGGSGPSLLVSRAIRATHRPGAASIRAARSRSRSARPSRRSSRKSNRVISSPATNGAASMRFHRARSRRTWCPVRTTSAPAPRAGRRKHLVLPSRARESHRRRDTGWSHGTCMQWRSRRIRCCRRTRGLWRSP